MRGKQEGREERVRERERNNNLLSPTSMHLLVDFICALTRDRTRNSGILEKCSNKLSYPARADLILYIEHPKDSTPKQLELINEFSKVKGKLINVSIH